MRIFTLFILFFFASIVNAVSIGDSTFSMKSIRDTSDCVPQNGLCECTTQRCDVVAPYANVTGAQFVSYRTTKSTGERLKYTNANLESTGKYVKDNLLVIDSRVTFQSILGFGGALTDAAAINVALLEPTMQEIFLQTYYGELGIQYSIGRIPIASCDFSTHMYSYDDVFGDYDMQNFTVEMDFVSNKAPLIQRALSIKGGSDGLRLFASPWSAPAWMKTTNSRVGGALNGTAGDAIHKAYALYLSKFITEYKRQFNIDIWGLTVQNEPGAGVRWDSMYFDAFTERDFIKLDLGPQLAKDHPNVTLMMLDDQRNALTNWTDAVLADPDAAKFIDGIAIHWYEAQGDIINDFYYLNDAHQKHPDKFILATEACLGFEVYDQGPKPGSFERGEIYLHDIIGDVNNWAVGWTDWNIALDFQGGPNHVQNFVDAPILINTTNPNAFYKQPMFYAMGHVSTFVQPGSYRVNATFTKINHLGTHQLEATAFVTADKNHTVVIVLNRDPIFSRALTVYDVVRNAYINVNLMPHTMQTFIYRRIN